MRKSGLLLVAAVLAVAMTASAPHQADAHRYRHGGGGIGLGIAASVLGSIAARDAYRYNRGYYYGGYGGYGRHYGYPSYPVNDYYYRDRDYYPRYPRSYAFDTPGPIYYYGASRYQNRYYGGGRHYRNVGFRNGRNFGKNRARYGRH